MQTGLEEEYIIKNNKRMRRGYTTGSCASAAAHGAVKMLLTGERISQVELMTPRGILLHLELLDIQRTENSVTCAVRKDGGDDPDMTNGLYVYATVKKNDSGEIVIDGGEGVGRVTRPGLEQPVGAAAINSVPRSMIRREVEAVCGQLDYRGGMDVIISVPDGERVAAKTFNPRLGIMGGISILGTSGIVEPMSEVALIKSIEIEMDMHLAQGEKTLLITPGNYGAHFVQEHYGIPREKTIQCSNYVGETIDMAVNRKVEDVLFVAHLGKFVKVAGGIMNTHSRQADSRMEILAANAIHAGAKMETVKRILTCETTDEALEVLDKAYCMKPTMRNILKKIQYYLGHHSYGNLHTEVILFSNVYGGLAESEGAMELLGRI